MSACQAPAAVGTTTGAGTPAAQAAVWNAASSPSSSGGSNDAFTANAPVDVRSSSHPPLLAPADPAGEPRTLPQPEHAGDLDGVVPVEQAAQPRAIWSMHTVTARMQRVVLPGLDLDAVGVAHAEPALRHLGDRVAVALDLVLVVDDVALRLHVVPVLDVDRRTGRGAA